MYHSLVSYISAVEQGTARTEHEKTAWLQVGNAESQSHRGSSTVKTMLIKSGGHRNSFGILKFHTLPPSCGAVTEVGMIDRYP